MGITYTHTCTCTHYMGKVLLWETYYKENLTAKDKLGKIFLQI